MQWMPIETAPKDRPILLYVPGGGLIAKTCGMVLAQWNSDQEYGEEGTCFETTQCYGYDDHSVTGATHWAEKPATPDEM